MGTRIGLSLSRMSVLAGLAGCFVIVSYLTLYWDTNPPASLLTSNDPNQVDFYAEQTYGIKFDENGKHTQTFRSPRVTRYTMSGETVMTTPELQLLTRDGDRWNGVAHEGTLVGDNEVELRGNVVITNPDQAIQLKTEQLRYLTDRQEVTSDVAVIVHKGSDTTQAIGARADLNRNRIELLHRVEGNYVQP